MPSIPKDRLAPKYRSRVGPDSHADRVSKHDKIHIILDDDVQIQLEHVELDQSNLMPAPIEMEAWSLKSLTRRDSTQSDLPLLAASTAQGWSRWRRSALLDLLAQLHGFYGYADAG